MSEVRAGMLLLATPELLDPNFSGTVVLLLDANAEGALGVVLNRPTALAVGEVLASWAEVVTEPEVLFQGGPVETDGALAVALRREGTIGGPSDDSGLGFRVVLDDLGLIDLDTPVELVADSLTNLRIFAGYAGWGSGQLDREVELGHWYVVPAHSDDVFGLDPRTLWSDVLRRQPGDLAMHATRPVDPELN